MYRSPRDPLKDELWAQGLSWSVTEMMTLHWKKLISPFPEGFNHKRPIIKNETCVHFPFSLLGFCLA